MYKPSAVVATFVSMTVCIGTLGASGSEARELPRPEEPERSQRRVVLSERVGAGLEPLRETQVSIQQEASRQEVDELASAALRKLVVPPNQGDFDGALETHSERAVSGDIENERVRKPQEGARQERPRASVEDLEEVSVGVPGSVPIRREAGVDGEARFRERQLGIAREEITVKPVERAVYRRYVQIYETAAKRYGFGKDWYVLAAVGKVESDHGGNMGPSSAGAMGPMQFLPSTWKDYGLDGNGDGLENIMDPEDAVPAAAAYLRRGGAPGDWEAALYSYNHSDVYVRKVLKVADRYRERDDSADKGAEVTW